MLFVDIERKIDEINQLISFILDDKDAVFFLKANLAKPDFKNQEFSFYRLISILYATYFEAGKIGLKIVTPIFTDEQKALYKDHTKIVNYFRTKLQHNLDPSKDGRSQMIQRTCMETTKKACGSLIAKTEKDWKACSNQLIGDSILVLEVISETLENTTNSESKRVRFKENWLLTTTREIEGHYFDRAIEKYIKFLTLTDFDIITYRNKNLDKWRKYIRDFYAGVDVEIEIERIVQSSIIRDFIHMLPVTLDDLNDKLIISNETFKDLYAYMDQLNSENPQSKDEFLVSLINIYGKAEKQEFHTS